MDRGQILCRLLFSGSPGRETPPPSASRAASAARQSLSAPCEQGVPGSAADYQKILNESALVVPSLETKLLAEPAQPCRGPATRAPWPSPRTTPSQTYPNSNWPKAGVFRRRLAPPQLPALPRWRTLHPLLEEDPSPVQPQSPSHVCLLSPNPGGLHPPFISPPLFILQSSLASRHLREASDPPPTQLSALPKPPPPPPDSITCPHPSPRFRSNSGLHARLSQPAPQAWGIAISHPPRSMLRSRLGDTAPAEGPSAAPPGAGQMHEAFVVSAGASRASALLRDRGCRRSGLGPR